MAVYRYDKSLIDVVWNGRNITGYGDSIITVEHNADVMSPTTGVKGDTVLNWSEDKNASVTLTLLQQADDNAFFEAAARNKITGPFTAQDRNTGRIIVRSAVAAIMRRPNYERSNDTTMSPWVIFCTQCYFEG